MKNQYGIRVGDRYEWDGLRITVSKVGRVNATINVLQPDTGSKWTKQQKMPFPDGFIKVHSAHPEVCEACGNQPPAPGMAYCDDCMDILAAVGDDAVGT